MFLPHIIKLWPAQDFGFRVDKYIIKKVRSVSLAHDTSATGVSSGPYLSLYQILSKYFKLLRSYGLHKNLA